MVDDEQSGLSVEWKSLEQATVKTRRNSLVTRMLRDFFGVVAFYLVEHLYNRFYARYARHVVLGLGVCFGGFFCVLSFSDSTEQSAESQAGASIATPVEVETATEPEQDLNKVKRPVVRKHGVSHLSRELELCRTLQQMERDAGIRLTQEDKLRCRAISQK